MDVDVEIQLFGLSSYYAAVEIIMVAHSQIMAVAATIAVYGLSFFFSSVAVAAVEMVMDSAKSQRKKATITRSPFLFGDTSILFVHSYY